MTTSIIPPLHHAGSGVQSWSEEKDMNEETDWSTAIPDSIKTLAGLYLSAHGPDDHMPLAVDRMRELVNIVWEEAQLVERMKLCRLD